MMSDLNFPFNVRWTIIQAGQASAPGLELGYEDERGVICRMPPGMLTSFLFLDYLASVHNTLMAEAQARQVISEEDPMISKPLATGPEVRSRLDF